MQVARSNTTEKKMSHWSLAKSKTSGISSRAKAGLVFIAALASALPAHAANGLIGWVWANQPTTASYTPDAAHSYNSRAAANTVTRFSAGVYGVEMDGLFNGNEENDVQVSAYDTSGYCQILDMGHRSAGVTIIVNCYNVGAV